MPGELNSPYRRDPFTGDFLPRWNDGDEIHVAALQESNGRFGFFTFEAPQLRSPSSFVCSVLSDEYDPTGTPLRENARLDAPDSDEFRVDYDADTYIGTGFVEVHASRVGQFFKVGYHGLGTPPRWLTHLRATLAISGDFSVAGNLTVGSRLRVVDEYDDEYFSAEGAEISAHGNRVQNVGTAVDEYDALPLGQAESLVQDHGVEILTGSGSWAKPNGSRYVLFVAIGPGGNGSTAAGGGGGGGGGAAVYGVADLDAIGGASFAYVAGTPGNDTTIFGCTAGKGAAASSGTAGAGGTGSVGANVTGKSVTGGNGANGSGGGTGGGGGSSAGGFGGVGNNASTSVGGASAGLYSGAGGTGTGATGGAGADFGAGGGGGVGVGGAGANGFILLIY